MVPKDLWRPTFPEFCRLLNDHHVAYLLVGGQAAVLFGVPRFTKDTDLLVDSGVENAGRLIAALSEIGFGIARELRPEEIVSKSVFSFMDQIKVDVFTELPGVGRYADAFPRRVVHLYRGIELPCVSIEHLIASKRAVDRETDRADIIALEEIRRRRPENPPQ